MIYIGFFIYYLAGALLGGMSMPVGYNMFASMGMFLSLIWFGVTYKLYKDNKKAGRKVPAVWFGPFLYIVAAITTIMDK